MKDSYRTIIGFAASQENVPAHDAVMVVPTTTGHNGHFAAQIFPYGKDARKAVNGRALLSGSFTHSPDNPGYFGDGSGYTAPTGDAFTISGVTNDNGAPIIVPVQAKSIGALTNCAVFGLI